VAYDDKHGYELWKSDGTEEGTVMVKDIAPGVWGSMPKYLTGVNETLYFSASDNIHGYELWKSDGTEEGTVMVKDISEEVGNGSAPEELAVHKGMLYFSASDGIHGYELWKSDGTEEGTVMVKDISEGHWASNPKYLTSVGDMLFFAACGKDNCELWKSDGTESGTMQVKNIFPDTDRYWEKSPEELTNVGGMLYFSADDGVHGRELWKSDGTETGTVMVKDIGNSSWGSTPLELIDFNGMLFFRGYDGMHGRELWRSDGTEEGTVMVKDIAPGVKIDSHIRELVKVNDTLFFIADASDGKGISLWKSNGTQEGTVMVKDIDSDGGTASKYLTAPPKYLTAVGNTLYFNASDGGKWWYELYKSDGTEAGTVRVPTGSYEMPNPENLTNVNGELYFTLYGGGELWKSAGNEISTEMVKYLVFSTDNSTYAGSEFSEKYKPEPEPYVAVDSYYYFVANDGIHGYELWKSDGTKKGTVMVKDIDPTGSHEGPRYLTEMNGTLYFSANAGGYGLWRSDGTEDGTLEIKHVEASDLINIDGVLYFSGTCTGDKYGLWRSDGSKTGTVEIKGISAYDLVESGGTLYFAGTDKEHGTELWKSDGTQEGTVMIKDIFPGLESKWHPNGSFPFSLTDVDGMLFFAATDAEYGRALWKSDGSRAGTVMVKDIYPEQTLSPTSTFEQMTAVGNVLFFVAGDEIHGKELWKSDGTEKGTIMVKDIYPGELDSDPKELIAVDGMLYFTAENWENGRELWKSDGTQAGTRMVVDLMEGWPGSMVHIDGKLNGKVFFHAVDANGSVGLYSSDGTEKGTQVITKEPALPLEKYLERS
jgi:ELWxxDGT repeat protein